MPSANPEAFAKSGNFVSASVDHVIEQGGEMGSILGAAMQMTGSDGQMFHDAFAHFSEIFNPIAEKMQAAMSDPVVRRKIIERIRTQGKSAFSNRNQKRDE